MDASWLLYESLPPINGEISSTKEKMFKTPLINSLVFYGLMCIVPAFIYSIIWRQLLWRVCKCVFVFRLRRATQTFGGSYCTEIEKTPNHVLITFLKHYVNTYL